MIRGDARYRETIAPRRADRWCPCELSDWENGRTRAAFLVFIPRSLTEFRRRFATIRLPGRFTAIH